MPGNETIIAVPITVEQQGQTRQFLVRLVEKLDIVLGYRGDDPYVSASQLESAQQQSGTNLTQLEQTVLNIITNLFSENDEVITQLNQTLTQAIDDAVAGFQSGQTISNNDQSTQTISDPPTQMEVQSIQDQVAANADDFNELLSALQSVGIIEP